MAVTHVAQRPGFVQAVACLPVQIQCPLVAGNGLVVVAELVVGVPEAVPGHGLSVHVGGFVQAQRTLTVVDALLVLSEQGVVPAQAVEAPRLSGLVVRGLEEGESSLLMGEGVAVPDLPLVHVRDVAVGAGLTDVVAILLVQPKSAPEVVVGVLVPADPGVRPGKSTVDPSLAAAVGQSAYGFQRDPQRRGEILPMTHPIQHRLQGPGKLPAVRLVPVVGGVAGGGHQHLAFGSEPGERRSLVVGTVEDDPGLDGGERQRRPRRVEHAVGGHGGMQVVVEHPKGCRVPVNGAVVRLGEFRGVDTQQVVGPVPAGSVLGHQVGAGQLGEQPACLPQLDSGQAGGRPDRDIGPGMDAEQPEEPGGGRAERQVGPGEHRPDVGGRLAAGEHVEAVPGLA